MSTCTKCGNIVAGSTLCAPCWVEMNKAASDIAKSLPTPPTPPRSLPMPDHITGPESSVTYSPTYLLDGPDNERKSPRQRPSEYESTILIQRRKGRRVVRDAVTFRGPTRDDADAAMLEWIEKNNAQEGPRE